MVLQVANESIQGFQYLGDKVDEIAARHLVARCYKVDGLLSYALEALEMALNTAWELKDRRRIDKALDAIAKIHSPAQALELVKKEASLAKKAGDVRRQLTASRRLAGVLLALNKTEEALKGANEAVDLQKKQGDKKGLAIATRIVAEVHMSAKRTDDALEAIASSQKLLREEGDVKGLVSLFHLATTVHERRKDVESAMKSLLEIVSTYKAAGWKYEETQALLELADFRMEKHGPRQAAHTASQAVKLSNEMGDKASEANAMISLADFQLASGSSQGECLRSASTARQLFQSLGDECGEAQAMQVIGGVYLTYDKVDKAVEVTREALELASKTGNKKALAATYRAAVDLHMDIVHKDVDIGMRPSDQSVENALEVAAASLDVCQEQGDDSGQATMWVRLSNLYLILKEGEAAMTAAKEALRLCERSGGKMPKD